MRRIFVCAIAITLLTLTFAGAEEVKALTGNTRQDGAVNEKEAKRCTADEIKKEGEAPERVVTITKTFTPPDGWKFRKFREDERDLTHLRDQALRPRMDPADDIIWVFWKDIYEYVDIWFDPELAIVFGSPKSVFNSDADEESESSIKVHGSLADSQKAANFPLRCDGNLVPPGGAGGGGEGGETVEYHWSAIVAGSIDLDVDTDNNAGVYGGPDRDLENEDRWESDGGREVKVGKYVPRNDGDTDADLLPGFADGFGKFGDESKTSAGTQFVKAVLDVSNVEDVIDWSKAKVRFRYSASDPNAVTESGEEGAKYYTPAAGLLRVWKKDASAERNPSSVAAGGDWVPGGSGGEWSEFAASKLFGGETEITLYLEGIQNGAYEGLIEVEFSPTGDGQWMPDEVKVTVVSCDLDVDSDNSAGTATPERDAYEDRIEDANTDAYPGKIICVNDGDHDADGIPDFADGFDLFADTADDDTIGDAATFTPVVLEFPAPLDPTKCRIKIEYDASDPSAVTRSGDAENGYTYAAASGSLRLWTKNADVARNKKPVAEGGDWVKPGEYSGTSLTQLGFGSKTTLWLEGIATGSRLRIAVDVDPDGTSGTAEYLHTDAVRVTVICVDLDIDSDNNNELATPDRNAKEEALEIQIGHPGKALAINELDLDKDAIPDFADGYDIDFGGGSQSAANASHNFVPVILHLSDAIDTNKATVTFTSATLSDPAKVTRTGKGTTAEPYVYTVSDSGSVRLWTKNGSVARSKDVVPGGDAILNNTVVNVSDLQLDKDRNATLYLEALRGSATLGDIKLKVELDPDGTSGSATKVASDAIKATVFYVDVVHPVSGDFATNHAGKALISAKQDTDKNTAYHTNVITTKAGKRAQSEDAKMTISAYVLPQPPESYSGLKVYFEVTDPDDLSHYEGKSTPGTPNVQGDSNPDDNRDPTKQMTWNSGTPAGYADYQTACLSAQSDTPVKATIGGADRWVAESVLSITDHYSGDNYQVRATMQNSNSQPFDTCSGMTAGAKVVTPTVKGSIKLIAWKRVYIEQDNMYTAGCTVTTAFTADADANDDTLTVDNSADFNAGDDVTIFWQGGSHDTHINGVGGTTVTVPDLPVNVPQFGGIRPRTAPGTVNVSVNKIPAAFGEASDGLDGGCFVEFIWLTTGAQSIPKYDSFPGNDNDVTSMGFCAYWFDNIGKSNVVQLVFAHKHGDGSFGTTNSTQNTCFITKDNDMSTWSAAENQILDEESIPHELGHLWLSGGDNGHVDRDIAHACHQDPNINCVMSYNNFDSFKDGVTEFCHNETYSDCIDDIRAAVDGL